MSAANEVLLIIGMFAVTFGVRYPVMALVGRMNLSPRVLRALKYVPPAVLSAIVFPAVLIRDGDLAFTPKNAYLVGAIVAIAVAWYTRSLLWTIGIGMICFLMLNAMLS